MATKPAKVGHLAPLAPSNVLKCARQMAVIHKKVFSLHKKVFSLYGRTRFAKVGPPPGAGVKSGSAKVAPTPYMNMSRTPG